MSISPSLSPIPRWPKTTAQLHPDGSITMTLNGAGEQLHAADLAAARVLVLERVARFAEETLGRPVRLHTTDPDGSWELAVHPDGHVDELASHPHPTSAQPTPRGAHRTARPRRPRHLALAALLVAFIATAGILLLSTGHPGSSPAPGDPATALSSPTQLLAKRHAAAARDLRAADVKTARRRAAASRLVRQRAARAQAASQRAAVQQRVARRAAARRRTIARRVSRRQAAARRAAVRPRTPPRRATQVPTAVAPAPPAPAPAPAAPARAVPQPRPVAPRPSPPPSPAPQCDIAFCG